MSTEVRITEKANGVTLLATDACVVEVYPLGWKKGCYGVNIDYASGGFSGTQSFAFRFDALRYAYQEINKHHRRNSIPEVRVPWVNTVDWLGIVFGKSEEAFLLRGLFVILLLGPAILFLAAAIHFMFYGRL